MSEARTTEAESINDAEAKRLGIHIDVPRLKEALTDLSAAFIKGEQGRYGMRIPAEPYRDGDLVCGGAVRLINRLEAHLEQKSRQIDALQATVAKYQEGSAERAAPEPPEQHSGLLEAAREWISAAPHGDNCFVSDHYEGDPGNQCNCGKDALINAIESGEPTAQRMRLPVITVRMLADLGRESFFEKTDEPVKGVKGVMWSQAAVDFACLCKVPVVREPVSQPPTKVEKDSG